MYWNVKVTSAATDSLKPDPANARLHDQANIDAIIRSLERFGQQKPIVVDENNTILAGNGTWQAAKQLGWTRLLVARTNLRGKEAAAFALADNRTAELARWDPAQLATTLSDLRDSGDVHLEKSAGFNEQRIDVLLEQVGLVDDAQPPLQRMYQLVIDCDDEAQQAAMFDQLIDMGLDVRVVSL